VVAPVTGVGVRISSAAPRKIPVSAGIFYFHKPLIINQKPEQKDPLNDNFLTNAA
jgi:hypothetical protein